MDAPSALAYVESHGVVLVAAKGPVPRMTEVIAGEPIAGSWWGHPKGHEIYAVLEVLTSADDVLVCRAVRGKVTLVHRRLWPALIRAAGLIGTDALARVEQEHTSAGHHINHEISFPRWAPEDDLAAAEAMTEDEAVAQLGPWVAATRAPRGAPTSCPASEAWEAGRPRSVMTGAGRRRGLEPPQACDHVASAVRRQAGTRPAHIRSASDRDL
jgi:hypothetical protein